MKLLPMNPLGATAVALANGFGMWIILRALFSGDPVGSAVAGAVVGMLTFGILIMEDTEDRKF